MPNDPITEEIRSVRRALSENFDNDVPRILADVRRRETSSERRFVRLPKRPVHPVMTEQNDAQTPD